MSHSGNICSAINNASRNDPAKVSALYSEKISTILLETPAFYDPSDVKDQPHVFSKNLHSWAEATKRVATEKSDIRGALEIYAEALLGWAREQVSGKLTPQSYLHHFVARGVTDPLAASTAALEETARRVDLASRFAAREFYRLARQDRGTAIAVLDELSPAFEKNEKYLKDIFDHTKVKQSLIKHAAPDDILTARPKIKKDIIPIPPGFF